MSTDQVADRPAVVPVDERPARDGAPRSTALLEGLALVLAGLLAIGTAVQVAVTGDLRPALLVGAGLAAVLLVVLGLVRFALFVPAVLALRTAVDAAHPAADSGLAQQSSALPASLLALLFVGTAVVWLAAQHRAHGRLVWSPVSTAAVALVGAGAVSTIGSAQPLVSAAELARVLTALLMFVVVEQLVTTRDRRRVLLAVFISALAPLVLVAQQALTSTGIVVDGLSRVRGTFVHPNGLGFYLVLLLVTGTAVARHLPWRPRLALLTLVAACSAALVASYSRGAWLALGVGLLVVGTLQSKRLIAGVVGAVALVLVLVPSAQARLTDLEAGRTERGTAGNSFVWRVDYWSQSLELVQDDPVSGIGLKVTQSVTDEAKAPHNDFLRVYVEAGVLGLIAYLGLLAALVHRARSALRAARAGPGGLDRGLAVGFAGCLGAFLVFSIGGNLISQVVVLWSFHALAAIARPGPGVPSPPVPAPAPVPVRT